MVALGLVGLASSDSLAGQSLSLLPPRGLAKGVLKSMHRAETPGHVNGIVTRSLETEPRGLAGRTTSDSLAGQPPSEQLPLGLVRGVLKSAPGMAPRGLAGGVLNAWSHELRFELSGGVIIWSPDNGNGDRTAELLTGDGLGCRPEALPCKLSGGIAVHVWRDAGDLCELLI